MTDHLAPDMPRTESEQSDVSGESDSGDRSPRAKGTPPRLSELLLELSQDQSRDRIALSDLLDRLRLRAFGPLLLVFSIPNIIPAPPGPSVVLGLPLVYLTFQMLVGGKPWFPAGLAAIFLVSGVMWAMARAGFFLITSTLA